MQFLTGFKIRDSHLCLSIGLGPGPGVDTTAGGDLLIDTSLGVGLGQLALVGPVEGLQGVGPPPEQVEHPRRPVGHPLPGPLQQPQWPEVGAVHPLLGPPNPLHHQPLQDVCQTVCRVREVFKNISSVT